jgi:hypothetical protein
MAKQRGSYEVTYIVIRPVTYRVEAASSAEAEEIGLEKGESIDIGGIIDFRHVSTKQVMNREKGRSISTTTSPEERLSDAAPDLLHALQQLLEYSRAEAAARGLTDEDMTWLETARTAIAKATDER